MLEANAEGRIYGDDPGGLPRGISSQPNGEDHSSKMFQNVSKCSKDWGRLNFESPNLIQKLVSTLSTCVWIDPKILKTSDIFRLWNGISLRPSTEKQHRKCNRKCNELLHRFDSDLHSNLRNLRNLRLKTIERGNIWKHDTYDCSVSRRHGLYMSLWALEWHWYHWESLTVFSMVFLSPNKMLLAYFMMFLASLSLAFFLFHSFPANVPETLFSASISLCVLRFFALPPDCFHCCACCADCVSQHVVALCSTWWSHQMSAYVRTCLPSVYLVSTEPRVSGQGCLPEGVETKRTIGSDWSLQQ